MATQYRTVSGPNPGVGPAKRFGVAVQQGEIDMEVWFNTAEDRQDWLDDADVSIIAFLFMEM